VYTVANPMPRLFILIWIAAAGAAAEYPVDWTKINRETLEHLQALLRIDTTNPPGNETAAAQYVKTVLERAGIQAVLLGPDQARLNLVARIRGNGSKRPLLIMGHTDVVGVQREKWTVDPFGGILKGGYIYGRGATDDKDNVTAGLMVMLLLKRLDVPLARDVIFVAESGEEGFATEGFRYLVERHWPEIDAEYALAEGGGGQLRDGKPRYITVAATEKVGRGVRLIAHGSSGTAPCRGPTMPSLAWRGPWSGPPPGSRPCGSATSRALTSSAWRPSVPPRRRAATTEF
jgi:acetylornithine deacetylase/succinyl-diaminopimelate desuccinylase-like protein